VALVLFLSQLALCQQPIHEDAFVVQQGIGDARSAINSIPLPDPLDPAFIPTLLKKAALSLYLFNFEKMLKAKKVISGDPRVAGGGGGMAATTQENGAGAMGTNTSGVGSGEEQILLGPAVTQMHPLQRGQKFIHEGLRVKQKLSVTNAAMLPVNGGPGPLAPAGERCKWLKNELAAYKADQDYYEAASAQATAAGNAAKAAALDDSAGQIKKKIEQLENDIANNC